MEQDLDDPQNVRDAFSGVVSAIDPDKPEDYGEFRQTVKVGYDYDDRVDSFRGTFRWIVSRCSAVHSSSRLLLSPFPRVYNVVLFSPQISDPTDLPEDTSPEYIIVDINCWYSHTYQRDTAILDFRFYLHKNPEGTSFQSLAGFGWS